MLTRSQVARRLGKSIATVRRLEDRALHPVRGARGVRLFDEWEVDRLKRDPERLTRYAQSPWFTRERLAKHRNPTVFREPARDDSDAGRALIVAAELEAVCEMLLDVPASHLLRAGVDESAFEVLSTAIELLRECD